MRLRLFAVLRRFRPRWLTTIPPVVAAEAPAVPPRRLETVVNTTPATASVEAAPAAMVAGVEIWYGGREVGIYTSDQPQICLWNFSHGLGANLHTAKYMELQSGRQLR